MRPLAVFFVLFIILFKPLSGQETKLIVRQRAKTNIEINISISDSSGNIRPAAETFIASKQVYFVVSPGNGYDRPYFKDSELNGLIGKISLWQEQLNATATGIKAQFSNRRISSVILSFSKSDLKIWAPFTFKSLVGESKPISFPEQYYDDYQWFDPINKNIKKDLDEKQYVAALKKIELALTDKKGWQYFEHMSFYPDFEQHFPFEAIKSQLQQYISLFDSANLRLKANFQFIEIENMASLIRDIISFSEKVTFYTSGSYTKSKASAQLFTETIRQLTNELNESKQLFESKKIELLENGSYGEYQFKNFIDLIYNKLVRNGCFSIKNGMLNLNNTLNLNEIAELKNLGWLSDFNDLIFSLESESAGSGGHYLFNQAIMHNLERQLTVQPKPYYEVFASANSLMNSDSTSFISFLEAAMNTAPIADELQQLEILKICYSAGDGQISEKTMDALNNGMKKLNEKKWREAKNIFELSIRQESQFAPNWFYLATSEKNLDEIFSAQARINQALILSPEYLSPKLFLMDWYSAQNEYDKILRLCNEILSTRSIYLFHFWKAKAYFELKQYNDALSEINNQCLLLNPNQEDVYFLLGDVYVALKKYDLAKDAYLKTQLINPFNTTRFSEKMKLLP